MTRTERVLGPEREKRERELREYSTEIMSVTDQNAPESMRATSLHCFRTRRVQACKLAMSRARVPPPLQAAVENSTPRWGIRN